MKKHYLLLLLLCPLLGIAQQKPNLFAGISLNNTVSTVVNRDGTYPTKNSSYVFPELHFGANIYVEKLNKIFFRIEATATYNIADYSFAGNNSATSTYSNTTKIKDFSVGINPQLFYNFNKTTVGSFYAGIGIAAYAIQSNYNNASYNSYTAGGALLASGSETDNTSLITIAATLKFGYTISKKVDIYLGYNVRLSTVNNTGYITYYTPNYISDQSVFKLGVNYRLGKR